MLVLCDIDGTIALRGDRDPYDHSVAMEDGVNWPIVHLVMYLAEHARIVYVTGREEKFRDITEYWMRAHNINLYSGIFMRPNDDNRTDAIVKEEIYEKIKILYGPATYVLDDRNRVVEMWRRLGLTCLQVADGNY